MKSERSGTLQNPLRLLQEEKELFAKHAVLRVRRTKLVERFHAELSEIGEAEEKLLHSIDEVQAGIAKYRRLLEVTRLPPELSDLCPGAGGANLSAFAAAGTLAFLEPRCRHDQPEDADARAVFESCIRTGTIRNAEGSSTQAPSRLEKVPSSVADIAVLSSLASVVYRHKDGRLLRRPATSDFEVMRSPQASVGRVLVSRRVVPRGSTLFVESPMLLCCDSGDVLPPLVEEAMSKILSKSEVFAKQRWDRRLVHPLMVLLATLFEGEARSTGVLAVLKQLCCPFDDTPPAELNALCDFGSFIHAGLPSALSALLTEDDVSKFLLVFQCNSVNLSQQVDSPHPLAVGAASMRALLGFASLIEHSCDPNACFVLRRNRSDGPIVEVRALRTIGVGERLSVAYIPLFASRGERQALLRRRYFFTCGCPTCSAGWDCGRLFVAALPSAGSTGQLWVPIGDATNWRALNWDGSTASSQVLPLAAVQHLVHLERKWSAALGSDTTDDTPAKLLLLVEEMLTPTNVTLQEAETCSIRLGSSHTLVVAATLRLLKAIEGGEADAKAFAVVERLCAELATLCLGDGEILRDWLRLIMLAPGNKAQASRRTHSVSDASWAEASLLPGTLPAAQLLATLLEVVAARRSKFDESSARDLWYGLFLLLKYPLAQEFTERAVLAQVNALGAASEMQQASTDNSTLR